MCGSLLLALLLLLLLLLLLALTGCHSGELEGIEACWVEGPAVLIKLQQQQEAVATAEAVLRKAARVHHMNALKTV
jgi:hypothetical protein